MVTNKKCNISANCVLREAMSVKPCVCFTVAVVDLNTTPKSESCPYPRSPEALQGLYDPVSSNEIWNRRGKDHSTCKHFGGENTTKLYINIGLNLMIRSRQNHNFSQCVIFPRWLMHYLYEVKIELWETMK